MSDSQIPLERFLKTVEGDNLWKTFEIKSCLFREDETSQWVLGFIYIQLREDTPYTAKGINNSRLKLLHEVKDIKYLPIILSQISSLPTFEFAGESVSLELLTGELFFDNHQRRNAVGLYDIDAFCYELIRGGNQPEGYGKLIRDFESILKNNNPPYENLRDACNAILGVDFGTAAFYPFIRSVAPILVNIDKIDFTEEKITIELNCSPKVDVNDLEANVFGKDEHGNTTGLRKKIRFVRKEDNSKAHFSVRLAEHEGRSDSLNIILSYKGQEIEDKGQKKSQPMGPYGSSDNRTILSITGNESKQNGTGFRNLELNLFRYDFAISFAGENRTIADKLHELIKDHCKVFYDRDVTHHLLGAEVDEVLRKVYGPQSRYVIVLVSKYYPKKDWTDFEFQIAKNEWHKRKRDFILPIRIDDTNFPGLPSWLGYLHLNENSIEEIATILLRKLKDKPNWA